MFLVISAAPFGLNVIADLPQIFNMRIVEFAEVILQTLAVCGTTLG